LDSAVLSGRQTLDALYEMDIRRADHANARVYSAKIGYR
jgi:hypothetical protein